MQFLPSGPLPPKRSKTGIARGRSSGGHWLRANTAAVDPATPARLQWRQNFHVAKLNWRSLGTGGVNNIPVNDIDPQSAWGIQAAQYFGILEAGLFENNEQLPSTLVTCANPEAYQVMTQTTLAEMQLAPLPTPTINSSYMGSTTTNESTGVGGYDFNVNVPTMPSPNPFAWSTGIGVEISGNNTSTWTVSLSGVPAWLTATLSATSFALVYNSLAGTSSGGVTLALSIAPNTAPATTTVEISVSGPGGNGTLPLNVTVTTGNLIPATPPPAFGYPIGLYSNTVYDDSYNVTGFTLSYQLENTSEAIMSRFGAPLPNQWIITASPQYTSSYTAPGASSYLVLTLNGQVSNNSTVSESGWAVGADAPLDAWVSAFGALPATGEITFEVQPVDPITGCPGPALSCTAEWAQGTLKGANLSLWAGPTFEIIDNGSQTGNVTGLNGYMGTVTLSMKAKVVLNTGDNATTKAFPAGLVFTFTPATIDVTADAPTDYPFSWSYTVAAGTTEYNGVIEMEGTDSISTVATKVGGTFTAGTEPAPPVNFLTVSPTNTSPVITANNATNVVFTISNTGASDQFVSPLTDLSDPDLTVTFDATDYTVPAGTMASPGTVTVTMTITAGATFTQPLPVFQFEASAGENSCYAVVNCQP